MIWLRVGLRNGLGKGWVRVTWGWVRVGVRVRQVGLGLGLDRQGRVKRNYMSRQFIVIE